MNVRFILDDVNVHLPPKKTIKNMDKTFIESRAKELEKYLTVCILYQRYGIDMR